MADLRIIGGRRSHELLRDVLGARPPCRVLDAPAGTGVLAEFLRERSFDVHCADIDPGNFAARGFAFTRVDLNARLPFADASFDAVVCANGLHRLFNPGGAVREFHRVLRSGGSLHVTVNHYASIDKRLRFLLYGSLDRNLNDAQFEQTVDEPAAHVRQALLWPQVANALEAAGFRVAALRPAEVRRRHRVLAPVAWGVRLAALLVRRPTRERERLRETNSAALLPGGKYLYAEAVKP